MSKNIDKIMYINLDRRTDRREEIEKELDQFELPYERFSAIHSSIKGIIGCTKSHLEIVKLAKERGYKNILILEDDFTFLVSKEEFENNLSLLFENNIPFDVCFLSYNVYQSTETQYPFLHKGIDVQTASGYIVNNHYYDKLIEVWENTLPLLEQTHNTFLYANDMSWKIYQPHDNWYLFSQRIGKQRDSYSDNENRFTDYNV